VASLPGQARTLAALHTPCTATLMEPAMRRELIVDVIEDDDFANDLPPNSFGP